MAHTESFTGISWLNELNVHGIYAAFSSLQHKLNTNPILQEYASQMVYCEMKPEGTLFYH